MSDLKKIDTMVLVTKKEQRNGSVAPIGTIYYTYHDDDGPYSVKPMNSIMDTFKHAMSIGNKSKLINAEAAG